MAANQSNHNDQQNTTVGCFQVKVPNRYAVSEANNSPTNNDLNVRNLQVKIIDVLYNNRLCSLVYLRNISSVVDCMENVGGS